jgi:hypothetical protein
MAVAYMKGIQWAQKNLKIKRRKRLKFFADQINCAEVGISF